MEEKREQADNGIITSNAIKERWLTIKIKGFFSKFLKPFSERLIELQYSDDEIPDFLPPDLII